MIVTVDVRGHKVAGKIQIDPALAANDKVWVGFKGYHVFDRETGNRTGVPRPVEALLG
jgi:hypothetical protein